MKDNWQILAECSMWLKFISGLMSSQLCVGVGGGGAGNPLNNKTLCYH